MAGNFQEQVAEALELIPEKGEIDFMEYKANLYAQNPDGGKEVFTHILAKKLTNRRIDFSVRPVRVLMSRKVGK